MKKIRKQKKVKKEKLSEITKKFLNRELVTLPVENEDELPFILVEEKELEEKTDEL